MAEVLNTNADNELDIDMEEFNEVDENDHDSAQDIIIERLDEYENLIIIKDSDGVNRVENYLNPLI